MNEQKINPELKEILKVIESKDSICLLAPAFPVDFKYPDIVMSLRKIGFDKIFELTYAAKLINIKYHKMIKENPNKTYICANCPSVVTYIENRYPAHKDKIIDVASPMVIGGRYAKKEFPKHKTVFVGPCITKKMEARESKAVDYAITFKELKEIIDYKKDNNLLKEIEDTIENKHFDKLYNDYTKIYPLSGAVAKTMHCNDILNEDQVLIADGPQELDKALKDIEKNKKIRFLDILFCDGGCIGGPGIISQDSTEDKKKRIISYKDHAKQEKLGKHFGKFKEAKNLNMKRN